EEEEEEHLTASPSQGEEKISSLDSKPSLLDFKKKKAFINSFATTLGKMHSHNIFHHDLKTCNIMVKENDGSCNFTFLDFDKVSFSEKITVRMRVKNLTQINLSTPRRFNVADRIRFLKEYLTRCNLMDKKCDIVRAVVNLSKEEKILYVSLQGDVTEDW
ncbi:MAG: lipopolysaccharide kinase InaA family protein, partial [Candidatus Scalindua rubra]|nr:lipopolysaccharide kinase InaA family protein [Candidatus Scalindua rubra]